MDSYDYIVVCYNNPMTAGVSAVILTKNEEAYIARCLISLKWCDEMLVIDDFSTDKTNMIAAKMGAKVIQHALDGDFSQHCQSAFAPGAESIARPVEFIFRGDHRLKR